MASKPQKTPQQLHNDKMRRMHERAERQETFKKTKVAPLRIQRKYLETLKRLPNKHEEQNRYADAFTQFYATSKSIDVRYWPNNQGLSIWDFFHCARDNEYFRSVVARGCEMVAQRMFQMVLDKELSPDIYFKLLPLHDKIYKEWLLESRAAAEKDNRPSNVTVITNGIQSSPLVPELENKEVRPSGTIIYAHAQETE